MKKVLLTSLSILSFSGICSLECYANDQEKLEKSRDYAIQRMTDKFNDLAKKQENALKVIENQLKTDPNFKVLHRDETARKEIINYIKQFPEYVDYMRALEQAFQMLHDTSEKLRRIPLTDLKEHGSGTPKYTIEQFTHELNVPYKQLKKISETLLAKCKEHMDTLISHALLKTTCPKTPLGMEAWTALQKGQKVKNEETDLEFHVMNSDLANFPRATQLVTWNQLVNSLPFEQHYDWKKSTLICTYRYQAFGTRIFYTIRLQAVHY